MIGDRADWDEIGKLVAELADCTERYKRVPAFTIGLTTEQAERWRKALCAVREAALADEPKPGEETDDAILYREYNKLCAAEPNAPFNWRKAALAAMRYVRWATRVGVDR